MTKIDVPFYVVRVRENSVSHSSNINRLKNYIPTFIEFSKLINKKLLNLTQDQYFADNVIYMVLGRLMKLFVAPFLINDRVATFNVLTEIFKSIFKDSASFVKILMCLSIMGELTTDNLLRENEMLKNKLKEKF